MSFCLSSDKVWATRRQRFLAIMMSAVLVPISGIMATQLPSDSAAIPVTLKQVDNQWQLFRDGQPYYIQGAGGEGSFELLKQCGGNSGRLWGVGENTRSRLDEAHRLGLSVAVGIWLEHERLGLIDYTDEKLVAEQFDLVIEAVNMFKDHPAVLVWGLGNEMEGYGDGDDPNIWNHVEKLAKKIKEIDPNHPTMTVIAEIGGNKIPAIHSMCPSLDIIGINSYGGAQ